MVRRVCVTESCLGFTVANAGFVVARVCLTVAHCVVLPSLVVLMLLWLLLDLPLLCFFVLLLR